MLSKADSTKTGKPDQTNSVSTNQQTASSPFLRSAQNSKPVIKEDSNWANMSMHSTTASGSRYIKVYHIRSTPLALQNYLLLITGQIQIETWAIPL